MKIRNKETGKTLEINVQPGQPMPTDAEIDQLFATQDRRDAIVAPAVAGAVERRNQANQAAIEQADPRLKAANELDTERAVDLLPVTSSIAVGPAAGVPGMLGTAARVALANPEVAGAVMGGAGPLMRGDLGGAAKGAFWGAVGGKVGGEGAAKLLKFVSRMGGGAAATTAEALAQKVAAGEMSQSEMLAALRGMSKPAAGYVENPSVAKVAKMMQPNAAPAATAAAPMTERAAAAGLSEAQATKQFTPGAESMKDIAAKVTSWRKDLGLSPGQIADSLREQYKIPVSVGKKIAQTVIDGIEGAAPNALQGPRIAVGAQNVARATGMTKEAVRRAAGPVLGEAVGEASPILPKQALQGIIDKMKSIPPAEREAYVARATSGKTQWQVENIRRTLEHLGLLLPLGAAGVAISKEGQ